MIHGDPVPPESSRASRRPPKPFFYLLLLCVLFWFIFKRRDLCMRTATDFIYSTPAGTTDIRQLQRGSRHKVASSLKKKRKKELILRLHNRVHHSEEHQRNERESTQIKTNPSIHPSVSIALCKWHRQKNRNLKNCSPPSA